MEVSMDFLFSMFVEKFNDEADFMPTSSMDHNYGMSELLGHVSSDDEKSLIQSYLSCTDDEWERKVGYQAHNYFIELIDDTKYPLTQTDIDRLATVYLHCQPSSLMASTLVEFFTTRNWSLKPIWLPSVTDENAAYEMAGILTNPYATILPEVTEFLRECKKQPWAGTIVNALRKTAERIGDRYEVDLKAAINKA